MIPKEFITEWGNIAPWQTNAQIEQDLIISKAIIEIFSNDLLKSKLAFRGGTALHKLFLQPQARYSEDIDLVQIYEEPIGNVLSELRKVLSFLGKPKLEMGNMMVTMKFGFETEYQPIQKLKLKVEINCREHFTVLGYSEKAYSVDSRWYRGTCNITCFYLEEILATKLRALFQRRKGRDLFDIYYAFQFHKIDVVQLVKSYKKYMAFSLDKPIPSAKEFLLNLQNKKSDAEFNGDIVAIIRPEIVYDQMLAFQLLEEAIISNM
jgi:predicted nucleotidyltransferase component of viral defense system